MLILKDTVHIKDIMWMSAVTLRVLVSSVTVSVLCEYHDLQWGYYVSFRGQR